ncbi:MAG TPA: DsrE family protein [Dehalococcoidia bacterium]
MVETAELIDVRGKKITTYILHEVVSAFSRITQGESVELLTDDFEPIDGDVRAWCRMTGHRLAAVEREAGHQKFVIEKGDAHETRRKLTLVLSNTGLEELLSPLAFAMAAALGGAQVFIYFQGPAVKVLASGFKERLSGIGRPFSGFARRGLAKIGHEPPHEKLRQLQGLGARLFACAGSMDHFGVKKEDFAFDDVTISEYVAFMELMEGADIHIFLQ